MVSFQRFTKRFGILISGLDDPVETPSTYQSANGEVGDVTSDDDSPRDV